jgi:NTP pyrophosphatase (non-canonical NTP hydrolase)
MSEPNADDAIQNGLASRTKDGTLVAVPPGDKSEPTLDNLHTAMVEQLTKDPEEILHLLTPKQVMLLHHALGMATEVGELLTAVKAHVIYGKPLDEDNVVEELGDFEFYAAGFRATLGILREDTLKHNMEKLAKRYPGYRYTDTRAIERADKVLEPPLSDDDYYAFCSDCRKETGHENGVCRVCGHYAHFSFKRETTFGVSPEADKDSHLRYLPPTD